MIKVSTSFGRKQDTACFLSMMDIKYYFQLLL
uniref:Uncharacterized protein n=1 Tax=Anguilla anguilla TaxID=7936 RepID=A0A0E9SPL2_ANGAN